MARFKYLKFVSALLLSAALFFTSSAAFAAPVSQEGVVQYKQFLLEKYDLQLTGEITKGDFIQAVADTVYLQPSVDEVTFTDVASGDALFPAAAALYEYGVLSGPAIQADQRLTNAVAVSIAVRAADLKELAYSYPQEKVAKTLAQLPKVTDGSLVAHMAQELAAAVDTGLLPAEFYADFEPHQAASEQLVNTLLGKVLEVKGLYKRYLGYVSDPDIYSKLYNAYATSDVMKAPSLQAVMNEALEQELVTGYSIKDSRYDANFIPELSVAYGHSDLKHLIQLIGLLRSEGLDAKVQYEPKTSAFIFLAEWGDPGPNVEQIANGNFISYANEYDVQFEFASAEDKNKFHEIITAYAKKDAADEPGLIYGSWWQPLYYSEVSVNDFEIITNNKVVDENSSFYVNPFSLNEDSEHVVEGLKAIDPETVIVPYQFWVNKPFYNYLHGEAL